MGGSQSSTSNSNGSESDLVGQQEISGVEADEGGNTSLVIEGVKKLGERHRKSAQFLKDKRNVKLGKQDSKEAQLLECAKEKVPLKKCALEMLEESERQHENTMRKFSESIHALTNAISSGFVIMQGKMQQPLYPSAVVQC